MKDQNKGTTRTYTSSLLGTLLLILETWNVDSPCDYFKQRLIYKIHFPFINSSLRPILSKICLMYKIHRAFFLLRTLTSSHIHVHVATVNFLNASCSENPFNSHIDALIVLFAGRLNIFATVYPRKQEIVLIIDLIVLK